MKQFLKKAKPIGQIIILALSILLASCAEQTPKAIVSKSLCPEVYRIDALNIKKGLGLKDEIYVKTGAYVLEDGAGSMVARAWLSEYAQKSIDIQYFIFSLDNIGLIACDYLIRAADRGVKVRILIDDIMVDAELIDILKLDSHENISIKIYNPGMNLGKNIIDKIQKITTDFRSANQRMHNKTFIVDEEVVITGGRNIADEYFDYDHEYNFRDRDILLIGAETQAVKKSFDLFWNNELSVSVIQLNDELNHSYSSDQFNTLHEYACNPDNFWPEVKTRIKNFPAFFKTLENEGLLTWVEQISFISDNPGKNDGSEGISGGGITTSKLFELVENASNSIDIQTPYLITTDNSHDLFKRAVDRGVSIRILTNSLASTDNVEAFSAYQSERESLLKTGVQIFEFRPDAAIRSKIMTNELHETLNKKPIFGLHAKSMVIDSKTTVIGTFNLDPRSANLNTECITIIESEAIAKGVLKGMTEEFKPENSWRITPTYNPDSEVSNLKRIKTWTRKILPKGIL